MVCAKKYMVLLVALGVCLPSVAAERKRNKPEDEGSGESEMLVVPNEQQQQVDVMQQGNEKKIKQMSQDEKNEALIDAAEKGNLEEVNALLEKGADVNSRDNWGWTALMMAAYQGHKDIVIELLKKGAEVNLKNKEGYTALMMAKRQGREDTMKLLLGWPGINVNQALMLAVQYGYTEIVKKLIDNGADVNFKDGLDYGWTPLIQAVFQDNIAIVDELIKRGADVNLEDDNGSTALIIAVNNDRKEIVPLLIKAGADVNQLVTDRVRKTKSIIEKHPWIKPLYDDIVVKPAFEIFEKNFSNKLDPFDAILPKDMIGEIKQWLESAPYPSLKK